MGPGEVAWDVDSYNLPSSEELAAIQVYVQGGATRVNALRPSKKSGASDSRPGRASPSKETA
jgi:hypothetical protein